MTPPTNPRPFLASLVGKYVVVKLKWGMEYTGQLECSDPYMNLQMSDVEEFMDGEKKGSYEELLIRCNNVLFVRIRKDDEAVVEEPMEQAIKEEAA